MTTGPILALVLGKFKCPARAGDRATVAGYRTVATTQAEVER